MAVIGVMNIVANCYYKYHSKTLIFMRNPCHMVTVLLIIVGFSKFSRFSEMVALAIFASAYGGWIGLIFSENEELPIQELVIYYVEHAFTSFLGPLTLCLAGRFNPLEYASPIFINGGYMLFTIYMRWVLCPVSLYTWANLNHTLCGVGNDPFFKQFFPNETYYLWAEFYLMFSCYVGIILNLIICLIVKQSFKQLGIIGID
jgi:hypothetical protein